jgi:hypothetical protein
MYLWYRDRAVWLPLSLSGKRTGVVATMTGGRTREVGRQLEWAVTAVAQPDAVGLVVAYLRAQHHLSDATLVTERPEDLGGELPVLLVEAVGEPVRSRLPWARQVRWRIGLQAWAPPDQVETFIYGALTALLAARGVRLPEGGRIVRVDPAAEPMEVPDRKVGADIRRVVTTVDVSVSY